LTVRLVVSGPGVKSSLSRALGSGAEGEEGTGLGLFGIHASITLALSWPVARGPDRLTPERWVPARISFSSSSYFPTMEKRQQGEPGRSPASQG